MTVFLSAYACEPDKGSEPGVGWRWAKGLAARVDLQVLTRESNRAAIEQAVTALPAGDPLKSATFHYHDLSKPWLWAKRHGLPTLAYYALWQWSVSRRFGKLADEANVVHHLTFCTLLCPGFWKLKKAAFVLGPVGAPQVNPHYFPLFGRKAWLQKLRGAIMARFLGLPWLRRLLRSAAAVVPANSETRNFLIAHGIPALDVILDTGAPEGPAAKRHAGRVGAIRLMYAGQLERRKGLELALRALARASGKDGCDAVFDIFGQGPDRQRLIALAEELGIAERVSFHGAVPQAELMRNFQQADAFLFTSVRDTSGGVNLEAMAHGLPIICIAHQGVGDITDESCAERIPAGTIDDTIGKIAQAIIRLANDPARRVAMGDAAAKRAREKFSWDEKFDRMCGIYHEITMKSQPNAESVDSVNR
jgi:glycosyltransferase involved in cell wall biosynthesis